jgi:hypothetical protein
MFAITVEYTLGRYSQMRSTASGFVQRVDRAVEIGFDCPWRCLDLAHREFE